MPMPSKPCRHCKSLDHWPYQCFQRPKKPRPIAQNGKVTQSWLKKRKEWYKLNPPNDQGYYVCYLQISPYCPRFMTRPDTTLDHVIPRSRAPELRLELSNLKPACYPCNKQKGSKSLDNL